MPSYTYVSPVASTMDAVRFEIQDTDPDQRGAWLLSDEEIVYAIGFEAPALKPSQAEVMSAGAHCMEALERRFAAKADVETGALRVQYSKMADNYAKRAADLRKRATGMHAPWAGGQSISEKASLAADPDRVQPAFSRNRFTSPLTQRNVPPAPLPGESGTPV